MPTPILSTKLYIPPPQPNHVTRLRLLERLNDGLHRKLTLISAPAGFGKTTVLSEWLHQKAEGGIPSGAGRTGMKDETKEPLHPTSIRLPPFRAAWLSLDEGDNDPTRFLTYLVAALQTIAQSFGEGVLRSLQSPQPPPPETILTALLNDIAAIAEPFLLILDDYHVIGAKPIQQVLAFLVEHLPPSMHLVIITREDPPLPLARLRARSQLTELRAADLRFTRSEAAEFLNRSMGLSLSTDNIAALEARTEGWIVGLQLAALSLQGQPDADEFIQSFTGSHRFVLDYLVEEVLQRQPESIQTFLLHTCILDRLCGPLCDAVLAKDEKGNTAFSLQPAAFILDSLERANLFIIPLDNERRWYRYHHLFADLLRQRLQQSVASTTGADETLIAKLHGRASQWFEDNGLDIEAFHHAAAAHDIDRAERLIEGRGIPLHLRGAVTAILDWLESLPTIVLNARPSLWWRYAALLLVNGQTTGVEEKLDTAEAALQGMEVDDKTRNLIGRIAAARAVLALTRYQADIMITQSRRALEYLDANNLSTRANAYWTLGSAYAFRREQAPARQALTESIALSRAAKDIFTTILATIVLAGIEELDNHLYVAAETYQRVLQLAGDQPLQVIGEVHLGLARIFYEWNDLNAAELHGQQSLVLARQYDKVIDRFIISEVFLARLKMARGDLAGSATQLAMAEASARQQHFVHRIPEVAAAQVLTLLRQGHLAAAAKLALAHQLPLSTARVHLAKGDIPAALAALSAYRAQIEAKGWRDEQLKAMILQAVALHAEDLSGNDLASPQRAQPLIEPLSQREIEILQLIAQGLSNQQIGERLFLALSTVKGHNRTIFDKLQVKSRTEAVARAHQLGII